MYVADSKLCTDENMRYIDEKHGRFITVLPATRKEHDLFRSWLQDHPEPWEATVHGRKIERGQVWKLMESPIQSWDGFRIIWAWSSQKSRHDREIRNGMMNASILNLEKLETKLRSKKCRFHIRDDVDKVARDAVGRGSRWVGFSITESITEIRKQLSRGRPSKSSEYRIITKKHFHVEWMPMADNIDFEEACDGIFPLITNDRKLSMGDVLVMYKYQPYVEKRHEQIKSVYAVAPVMLKNVDRIEGLLFVYFLALLIESLMEREVRN